MTATPPRAPGVFGTSPVAPLSIHGSTVDSINQTLDLNERLLGGQRQVNENRFWSTPPRFGDNRVREVYTVTLNTTQEINYVSLELPRFPHRTWLQYLDDATGDWLPVLDMHTTAPVSFTITDSLPAKFLALADSTAKNHPQHYGAGHWVAFKTLFRTVKSGKFRLVMARIPGIYPLDRSDQPAPYPLGVRNMYLGFDATDYSLIPRLPFVSDTEHQPFAASVDMLRSRLSYALRENKASNVLGGGVWRSSPQPIRNAVVNFYVDARDADGNAQVIDRFFIDPLYTGPKINLYYSRQSMTKVAGEASDRPLLYEVRSNIGVDPSGTGLLLADASATIDIDNSRVRFDPSAPWWVGITFQPQFGSDEAYDHTVFAMGANNEHGSWVDGVLSFGWSAADLAWRMVFNGQAYYLNDVFVPGQQVSYTLAYDGQQAGVFSPTTLDPDTYFPANGWAGEMPPSLRFGMDDPTHPLVNDGAPQNFRLINLVMKNDGGSLTDFETYLLDPYNYVVKKAYPYEDDNSTNGSVLRYDDVFKTYDVETSQGFLGFVGEPLIDYESMTWIPVNRDYESRRGYLSFNPVSATAFKFEFYDLSPQNYDSQAVVTRTVRLFPVTTPTYNSQRPIIKPLDSTKSGAGVAYMVENGGTAGAFNDATTIGLQREGNAIPEFSPTEAMYAEDPTLAERIRLAGSSTNYMRWVEDPTRFRFSGPLVHYYRYVDVRHDHKVAFFAGLQQLQMYRLDYTAEEDTDQYLEVFHDDVHFGPAEGFVSVLNFLPGSGLYSDQDTNSTVVEAMASKPLSAKRMVRAIQFATTQSDAYQMLVNADFDDTSLVGWEPIGGAIIASDPTFNSTIGSTVRVSRSAYLNTWNQVEVLFPTWDSFPAGMTWDGLSGSVISPSPAGGIASTDFQTPSPIGRLYAAARVYAPSTLTHPLSLQIVSQNGQVLAEADKKVIAGSVTEWHVGYTIGEGGATDGHIWNEIEALYPTWDDIEATPWSIVESSTLSLTGNIGVRLIQKESSRDTWYVDNLSLFDDPIVWDFSSDGGATWWPAFDIRNNPRGVFVFPTPGRILRWRVRVGRGGAWVSAIDVRPMYSELAMGIPYREGIEHGDANVAQWDHYNPIIVDARFKMWDKPIPEWWYFVNRQWLMHQTPATVPPSTTLRETIVAGGNQVEDVFLEDVVVLPAPSEFLVLGEVLMETE